MPETHTDAVAVTEMMTLMCSWAFMISLGLMLCTVARSDPDDKMYWHQTVYRYRLDPTSLSEKERTFLLRPRPLFSRTIDGRTEWRYRIDDEWVYPTAEAVAAAKM
jgi:hypothetical protein